MSRAKREVGAACALLRLFSAEAVTIALALSRGARSDADAGFALHYAGVTIGSFTFEVIGGSLRAPSSRRRSKSSEIFA